MYQLVDKVTHSYEDGDKVVMFRMKNLNGENDRWGVDVFYDGRHKFAHRFDTNLEALTKYNDLIRD